jgi:hypothetical protein
MIYKNLKHFRHSTEILSVESVSVSEAGEAELTLLDRLGRAYENVIFPSREDLPQKNDRIICALNGVSCLPLARMEPTTQRAESAPLSGAGEHPATEADLESFAIRRGDSFLVARSESVYISPLRVQGSLEISAGGAPAQSVAVAEPLISYLSSLLGAIQALQTDLALAQTVLTDAGALAVLGPALSPAGALALTALGAGGVYPPILGPDNAIMSEIAKIER